VACVTSPSGPLTTQPTREIRTKSIFGSSLINNEVSSLIDADVLPSALAEGRFVAAPEPYVVGTGLESIQAALAMQKRGVSASTVVVSLPVN